jgi:hypothetical protein
MVETYNKTYRYILLLLAVAISALVVVATLFRPIGFDPLDGDWGEGWDFKIIAIGSKPELFVLEVKPDTPIGRTGIKPGDSVVNFDFRIWHSGLPAGFEFPFSIKRPDGSFVETTVTLEKKTNQEVDYVYEVSRLVTISVLLVIGLLIGLSRGQSFSSRWLALLLLIFALNLTLGLGWEFLLGLAAVVEKILSLLITLTFGVFWISLARQITKRKLNYFVYFFVTLWSFQTLKNIYYNIFTEFNLLTVYLENLYQFSGLFGTIQISMEVLLLGISIYVWQQVKLQSDPNLRDRVFWIVISLGAFPLIPITGGFAGLVGWFFGHDSAAWNGVREFRNYLLFLLPVGTLLLGFAILKKRIFNFSFVLNRALLYSFLSVSLLIAFYAAKGALEAIVKPTTTEAGTAISAGVAFLIYLAFHHVYDHVKEYMEHWLFKSWHHNEQQLKGFVRRAAFIEDDNKLREGFLSALNDFGHGCDIAFFEKKVENDEITYVKSLGNNIAIPIVISGDDPWVLTLRDEESMVIPASHSNEAVPSRLFPQFHRGELLGFVWIGSKSDGENWRPDEESVLFFAVQQIGLDRYALEVSRLSKELEREKMTTDLLKEIIKSNEIRSSV